MEERFYPGDKVVLHYCIHRSGEQADRFASEPLKPVYQGIVSREFLLFYGCLLYTSTFNMGLGMIVAVDPADVDKTMEAIRAAGDTPYVVGRIEDGEKGVELC